MKKSLYEKTSRSQVEKYSNSDLQNMSEDELKELIQSGIGTDSERQKYISLWVKKHYQRYMKRIPDSISVIEQSIYSNGVDNNKLIVYLDSFLSKTNYNMMSDYLILIDNMINVYNLDVTSKWLYEPWLYDESVQNNVYKLRAILFVMDSNNVKKFQIKSETGKYITLEDLLGKTASEMLSMLDNLSKSVNNYTNRHVQELKDDVSDALFAGVKLSRSESRKYFDQVYRPGMTEDEIIQKILNVYGSSL